MEVLNNKSLSEILTRCFENQQYKAAIVFANQLSLNSFIDEMKLSLPEAIISVEISVSLFRRSARISFENGSIIDVFIATPGSRGRRYNEIIYDGRVSLYILEAILQPMLVSYRMCGNTTDKCDDGELDSKELDEFLNLFRARQ